MSKDTKKKEEIQLSAEEQEAISYRREALKKMQDVENKIIEILKEANADLGIDPNSPFGQPKIVVKLL